jgi:amphi-Trp domain-containing protein
MAKKDGAKARPGSQRFEVEETMSANDAAAYLEGLARGLREGTVVLGGEPDGFRAAVASDVDFEVEARSGKRRSRIELTLAFRPHRAEAPRAEVTVEAGGGEAPPGEEQPHATIPDEMSF